MAVAQLLVPSLGTVLVAPRKRWACRDGAMRHHEGCADLAVKHQGFGSESTTRVAYFVPCASISIFPCCQAPLVCPLLRAGPGSPFWRAYVCSQPAQPQAWGSVTLEEAEAMPGATWNDKSLKPAWIPHPGPALGVNFVLRSPEEVAAPHQPAGLAMSCS